MLKCVYEKCNERFIPKEKRQKYCSVACQRIASQVKRKVKKVCSWVECKNLVDKNENNNRFCSKVCEQLHDRWRLTQLKTYTCKIQFCKIQFESVESRNICPVCEFNKKQKKYRQSDLNMATPGYGYVYLQGFEDPWENGRIDKYWQGERKPDFVLGY